MALTATSLDPPSSSEPPSRRPMLTRSASSAEHFTADEQDRLLFDVLSRTRVLEEWERDLRQRFHAQLRRLPPPGDAC